MRRGTALVPTWDSQSHHTVEVIHLETAEDMHTLRADEAWHEGAMAVLTYPTRPPQGFLSHDGPPRAYGGIRFLPGAYITKDEAGNFGFLRDENAFQEESISA